MIPIGTPYMYPSTVPSIAFSPPESLKHSNRALQRTHDSHYFHSDGFILFQ